MFSRVTIEDDLSPRTIRVVSRFVWNSSGASSDLQKDRASWISVTREGQAMLRTMRGSVASYVLVAAAAAGSSALPTWLGGGVVTPSAAQPGPATVQQILSQPLADLPGHEVRISIVERAPGTASAPHRHPGHHTFGYVVEGTYEFAIDRQTP